MKKVLKELLGYIRLVVVVLLITTLMNTFVFTFSTVRQRSMEKTLRDGDILIVERLSYWLDDPMYGDIIVFVEDDSVARNLVTRLEVLYQDIWAKITFSEGRERLVKRVIGLPGDEIDIKNGSVYVNGRQLSERYVTSETVEKTMDFPIVVPEGSYFVMGDNRAVSRDSRQFGCISRENIEGKAMIKVYPFSDITAF